MRISDWSSDVCSSDLQVGGGRRPGVDQEIAVLVRHHGPADGEPAAAGSVDELPGLMARRVFEGAAAGAAADRLAVGPLALAFLHARPDLRRTARGARKRGVVGTRGVGRFGPGGPLS